jgi:Zn-dependent protease
MAWGTLITKVAGPLSNLILASGCAVALVLLYKGSPGASTSHHALFELVRQGLLMNVGLAVFNMIPIHPLDGAGVLEPFIPRGLREAWNGYLRVGPILLMVLLVTGSFFLSGPIGFLTNALVDLAARIAA